MQTYFLSQHIIFWYQRQSLGWASVESLRIMRDSSFSNSMEQGLGIYN
jgi:hypothetical protein